MLKDIIKDYGNEPFKLHMALNVELMYQPGNSRFLDCVDDKVFGGLIDKVRATRRVRTMEQRFFGAERGNSQMLTAPQEIAFVRDWMGKNPDKVERLDALADVLNQTKSAEDFRGALYEMYDILHMPHPGVAAKTSPCAPQRPQAPAPDAPASSATPVA